MVRFFRSLRFRLIILAVAALLPALGVIIYNALEDRREATAAAQDQLRRLVALVAREQEQKTMAARHLLMGLAQVPAVRRQEAANCNALFARLISKHSLFINIGAIDRAGNIFASALPMTGPLNTSHLRYFQKALETRDFAVGNLQYGRIVLEPVLIFAYPLLGADGEVQTVIYASVSLDWLYELAAQARLPAGAVLAIIDEQGAIMAKYPESEKWVGKNLPSGGLFDIMQKRGEGMTEAQWMDGVPGLYAFTSLGREPRLGFVFAGIPTRVVYGAADQALQRNLAVLGGVLLLALGLAWGFGYLFIMRRINPLVRATARLAAGDLAVRTGLTGGPEELGQLAQAFDRMAASLEEREAARQQAEEEIKRNEARLASLLRISQYPAASIRELLDYVLSEAITLTGSKIGYLYQYDEATEQFTLISYSKEVMKECSVPPKDLYILKKTGIWGEAVRQRRPIRVNDFQAPHALKKGYPEGHAELYNYLTIPVFTDHRIVGVVGIANKATDYDESDIRQLTLMMESVWQIAERRRAEAERDRLFNLSIDMLCIAGLDGFFKQVNPAWGKTLGWTDRELLSQPWLEFVHPEDRAATRAAGEHLAAGEAVSAFENRYLCRDGSYRWVSWNSFPLREEGLIFCVARDVTEGKQAEAELAATKARLEKTFAVMGEMVLVVDPATHTITACNQAVQDIFGYRPEEVVGRNTEFLHVDRAAYEEFGRLLFPALDRDGRAAFEFQMKRQDGSFIPCEHSVTEIRDEAGRRIHIVGVIRDVTARKQAEAALRQGAEEMAALHAVAHQVNSSLALDQVVSIILGQAVHPLAPDLALLYLWQGDELVFQGARPEDAEHQNEAAQLQVGECLCGLALNAGEPVYSRNIHTDPRCTLTACKDTGLRSFAALPLLSPEGVLGVLGLAWATEQNVAAQAGFLETIAQEISLGLHNALIYEKLRDNVDELDRRVLDLAALYAASQKFLGQIRVAETLTQACRLAVEQFQLKLAWVGLTAAGDYLVHPAAVWGEEAG